MDDPEQTTSHNTPFWIGDQIANDAAEIGSELIHTSHEDRPRYPGYESVALKLMSTNEFEAFTSIENGTSTIHISRGWIVYAYEALIGASMNAEWPPILATRNALDAARVDATTQDEINQLMRSLSGVELARIAFRFVYLHEFFHASLGHTKFLTERFSSQAFATLPTALAQDDVEEIRKIRAAFELEADACAFKTLLLELFDGRFDNLFASRGAGVLAIGFVAELMYKMNLELAGSPQLLKWEAVFQFDSNDVYTTPIRRRWYLLTKLFESCNDDGLARAFENCIEYGASIARKCYRPVATRVRPPSYESQSEDDERKAERHIAGLVGLMKTGQAIVDVNAWVRYNDSIVERIRPELLVNQIPRPYQITFVLDDEIGPSDNHK